MALTIKLIPKNIWERNHNAAKDLWKDGKLKKWYYGIPIILIWILIVLFILKILFLS